jgi:hypothetical protein
VFRAEVMVILKTWREEEYVSALTAGEHEQKLQKPPLIDLDMGLYASIRMTNSSFN